MSLVTEVLAPRYGIAWYPWAVQYFFLAAISYTSLWLSLPGLFGKKNWEATTRLGMLVCFSTAIVAPIALLADLHQPLRFWHFYAYPTPWSWMNLGSLILPLYFASIMALGWAFWRPSLQLQGQQQGFAGWLGRLLSLGQWKTPAWLVPFFALCAILWSLGMALYTGMEIAVVKGRPLWHTPWLPPMFVTTGMLGACGLILVLNRFSGMQRSVVNKQMLTVIMAFCVLCAIIALTWYTDGINQINPSVTVALKAVQNNSIWRETAFWGLTAGGLTMLTAWFLRRNYRLQGYSWLLGLLALHVNWMFRWTVLMDVQTIGRNTAGFNDYVLALGPSGLLGIIGTFGLWIALILLIDMFIPWRGEPKPVNPSPAVVTGVPSHG